MAGEIAPELVERMVAVAREVAERFPHSSLPFAAESRAINALLPPPVDPDLIEARKIACDAVPSWDEKNERECMEGEYDNNLFVVIAEAAIKRGRELERGE